MGSAGIYALPGLPLGTISITSVTQAGRPVIPIATDPSFPDALDVVVADNLATLAPGAARTITLPVVSAGPTGHALEAVTWSPLASLGELYPVRAGGPLRIVAAYSVPLATAPGPPLCPATTTGAVVTASATLATASSKIGVLGIVAGAAAASALCQQVGITPTSPGRSRQAGAR